MELAETHEVRNPETLLQLIRWTLGPGPKMVLDKFKFGPNHTWHGFLRLMESKYSLEITHARIRSSLNAVSLPVELRSKDTGDLSTQNSRAVTRAVNTILRLANGLPEAERTELAYCNTSVSLFKMSNLLKLLN